MTILGNMASGYGLFIIKACVAMAAIAGLAWVLVRYAGPRLRGGRGARMRVLERLPLEPRRSLYLVEVEGKKLLIGVSDGSVNLIDDRSLMRAEDGR